MQASLCCQCNMSKLCMFTGTDDSTKKISRLDGHLSCNFCFKWGFLNTCSPTTLQPVTHPGTFLCMCLTHVLEIVAVRFSSFKQNLCGCAKLLHALRVFEFHFHCSNIRCPDFSLGISLSFVSFNFHPILCNRKC